MAGHHQTRPYEKNKNFQLIRDILIRPEAFYKDFVSDLPQVRSFFLCLRASLDGAWCGRPDDA